MKKRNQVEGSRRFEEIFRRCCDEFTIRFMYDPNQPSPSWEETAFIAQEAYRSAMQDVPAALEGDFSKLEGLLVDGMRVAIVDTPPQEPLLWLSKEDLEAMEEEPDSE